MSYLVFDIVIAVILIIFAVHGAYRGLVLSLCGLVAVVIAFIGAGFAARTFSPMVADLLEPRFAAAIEARLDEAIEENAASDPALPETVPPDPQASGTPQMGESDTEEVPLSGILEILRDMGLYEDLIDTIDQAVQAGMTAAAASAAAAVAAALAESVAFLVVFLVGFFVILLVWKLISHALDLVARIPGLHFLNKTGGAIFGLLKACILLFVLAWLIQYLGNLIPEETVKETVLLQFFMKTNPFELLSNLSASLNFPA